MLYQMLQSELEKDPKKSNTRINIEQYEKQRNFFLKKRLTVINSNYELNDKESKILLAYFNTAEREHHNEKLNNNTIRFRLLSTFKMQKPGEDLVDDNPINPAFLGWLKIYWSSAWREFAEDNKYILSARFAILRSTRKKMDQSYLIGAVEDLSNDLKEILPKAEKKLGLPLSPNAITNPIISSDKKLDLDIKKLKWLSHNNIGKHFQDYIKSFKNLIASSTYNVNKRLDIWDNPLYFIREVACLRWKDRIEGFVTRKRENPPALTFQFAIQITQTIAKKTRLNKTGDKLIEPSGKVISTFDPSACISLVALENILGKNLPALSSKVTDPALRWMVIEAHKRDFLFLKEPNYLEIEGGWKRLGEVSGAGANNKAIEQLKFAIAALSGCQYAVETKEGLVTGNLLSYEHIQAKGRRASKLRIFLSRPLCPGFVEDIPTGVTKYKRERFLIPVVSLPTFIGEAKTHASQSNFQWQLIIEMRLRVAEIYQRGGILVDGENKLSLAKKAHLSPYSINDLIDNWIYENYLEEIDENIYFLGSRYPDARRMLKEAGEDQILGAEQGRKLKKAKKLRFKPMNHIPLNR